MARKNYWLMKTEPTTYSWDDLVRDGSTHWNGVRNFLARNHMRAMRSGDGVLIYHSVEQKAVVGVAEIVKEAYADDSASEGDWSMVDLKPVRPLKTPVTLATIKADPTFANMALLRQSRLSVCPCSADEFNAILRLGR